MTVSFKRLNYFTRKKRQGEGRTFQVLGTVYAKTLWRETTDLKVSEAGEKAETSSRRQAEARPWKAVFRSF